MYDFELASHSTMHDLQSSSEQYLAESLHLPDLGAALASVSLLDDQSIEGRDLSAENRLPWATEPGLLEILAPKTHASSSSSNLDDLLASAGQSSATFPSGFEDLDPTPRSAMPAFMEHSKPTSTHLDQLDSPLPPSKGWPHHDGHADDADNAAAKLLQPLERVTRRPSAHQTEYTLPSHHEADFGPRDEPYMAFPLQMPERYPFVPGQATHFTHHTPRGPQFGGSQLPIDRHRMQGWENSLLQREAFDHQNQAYVNQQLEIARQAELMQTAAMLNAMAARPAGQQGGHGQPLQPVGSLSRFVPPMPAFGLNNAFGGVQPQMPALPPPGNIPPMPLGTGFLPTLPPMAPVPLSFGISPLVNTLDVHPSGVNGRARFSDQIMDETRAYFSKVRDALSEKIAALTDLNAHRVAAIKR